MDLFRVFRREFHGMELDEKILEKIIILQETIEEIYKRFSNVYYDYQDYINQKNKKIYSIENSFELIKRIYHVFHNIQFSKVHSVEINKENYLQNKATNDQKKYYQMISQLLQLLNQIKKIVENMEIEFKGNNKYEPKDRNEYEKLELNLEETIEKLNKNYKEKNKLLQKVEQIIKKIQENTEVHKLKMRGSISKIAFHRHTKLKELILLQNIPFLELNNIKLRSHFKFNLHVDNDLLMVKHYNLKFKKGMNIHVIPEEYDEKLKQFLRLKEVY